MTRVLSIQKRRGVAHVTLEDGDVLRVPSALYRERQLAPGAEVDAAAHRAWMDERGYRPALDLAVASLSVRPRTVQEIDTRLAQAGYTEATRDRVVTRLRREGYLNDAEFADQWTQARSARALGTRRIAQELRRKGVAQETIEASLAQVDEEDSLTAAAALAAKLLGRTKGKDDRDVHRKVYAALLRRGFGYDMARQALARAGAPDDE